MDTSAVQSFLTFFNSASDLIVYEVSQSLFWYQVVAIACAVVLSLVVSGLLSIRLLRWEAYFSQETIRHKLLRFSVQLVRRLLFSIFAALFLSLGASVIAEQQLLPESSFNLINIGYQVFYAWALLVFLIQRGYFAEIHSGHACH